jgi:anti-sigma B factor antagonist
MGFQVSTREVGRIIVLDAAGRLTLGAGGTKLGDSVNVFVSSGHKKFLLNLAGVHFIDSYGIGELVRCYSVIRRMGGEMKLVRVNQSVLDLLQITRLDTLFDIHSEELIALREFQ